MTACLAGFCVLFDTDDLFLTFSKNLISSFHVLALISSIFSRGLSCSNNYKAAGSSSRAETEQRGNEVCSPVSVIKNNNVYDVSESGQRTHAESALLETPQQFHGESFMKKIFSPLNKHFNTYIVCCSGTFGLCTKQPKHC